MNYKKITIFFILLLFLTFGCNKKEEIKEENKPTIEEKIDYDNKVLASTVNIITTKNGFGAGFAIEEGYIVTNYHVVSNNGKITIVTSNKEEYEGSIIGYDQIHDIAILKMEKKLEPSSLGDSDKIKPNEELTAIGNPNGDLSFSKAKGKVLEVDKKLLDVIDKQNYFIWYDGEAVSGYSGGPVYNNEGKIIGILNNKYVGDLTEYGYKNLCGIIPINKVKEVIDDILAETK